MLRGVLEQLGEMGNVLPRYTAPRCLLPRQAVGGCDVCVSVCPHAAIEVLPGTGGIGIDPQACTGCGLCVQACPTGALEYDLLPVLQAVSDQKASVQTAGVETVQAQPTQAAATLTCSQSGAGGPSLTCLGRVTPALLSAAGAWNVPLTLLHGECQSCPVGSPEVPAKLLEVVQDTARLREPTGRAAQVTIRPAAPGDRASEPRLSRRGAFGALLRVGKQQLARQIPDKPLPFVDWSVPAQRTPQEWRWRQQSLKPGPPAGQAVYWPAPLVDDTCIDCPVCANVCPTEAITRDLQPGGGVRLLLSLGDCTGCMGCVRSCPPQAMHEQPLWQKEALGAQVLLRESESVM